MPNVFTPILYVYPPCPFCFKVRVFLLEAGLADSVDIVDLEKGTPEDKEVRERAGQHLAKVSFPTLQTGPDAYMGESDDIIAHFERQHGVSREGMATYNAYMRGPFEAIRRLYRENRELKEALDRQRETASA